MPVTHHSIRDLLNDTRDPDSGRTAAEDAARVALPGDAVEATLVNPYIHMASTRPLQVLALLDSGTLSKDDEELAHWALDLFGALEGQPVRSPAGVRRY